MELSRLRIVSDVSSRSLAAQPFSNIPLGGTGLLRKFARRLWTTSPKRLVQSQLVTDAH
jgi:hypothetical protein